MSFNNVDDNSSRRTSNVSDANSDQNGYQDWHYRFNIGLGELLPNWSVFSPFRRRSSKSQSAPQSPGKAALSKECLPQEHIELVHFPNSKGSESPWKRFAPQGDLFSSSTPVIVRGKPYDAKVEGKHIINIPSTKEESLCSVSLKKLAAFLWEEHHISVASSLLFTATVIIQLLQPCGRVLHIQPSEGQGVGHNFEISQSNNPTWCDKCGELLWGLYQAKYMRCQYCHYTCHPQCRDLVTLDCRAVEAETLDQSGSLSVSEAREASDELDSEISEGEFTETEASQNSSLDDDSNLEEGTESFLGHSEDELKCLVEEYTASAPPGLGMTLEENGKTFRGFIRVHMNLSRPISVVAGSRPPSIYDILKEDETIENTLTSFYLPRDTVKALHITSETTTHEVVVALLKKFKVVDNPRKFALYERFNEDGDINKVKMRRIGENEKPLALALQWQHQADSGKMFVLQENETEDIMWEAFTLPELGNFLRILDREEEEYKKKVHQKYELIASKLQEAMDHFKYSCEANNTSEAYDGSVGNIHQQDDGGS